LRTQLNRAFQYFEPSVLTKYEAEFNAILRFLVWRFSVYNCDATIGQIMLNMKFSSKGISLSLLQKVLFGFSVVGIPYLKERSTEIRRITDKILDFNFIWRCVHVGEKLLQAVSVLNFLVFLQKGKYPLKTY